MLDLLICQVSLRIQGGGAAVACGGDGLAVDMIGDVACGEDSGDVGGGGAVFLENVAVLVEVELIGVEEVGVGDVSDGDEDAGDFEFGFFAGLGVFEFHGAHFLIVVREVFRDDGIPDRFYFFISEGPVGHDF